MFPSASLTVIWHFLALASLIDGPHETVPAVSVVAVFVVTKTTGAIGASAAVAPEVVSLQPVG